MNDLDDTEPAPRRRRGCFRGCFLGVLGLLTVVTLVVWGGRAALRKQGERQLQTATRQLDADEPGWRLEAIEAERVKRFPPPDQSSAPLVLEIADRIPRDWQPWWHGFSGGLAITTEQRADWPYAGGVSSVTNHLYPERFVARMKEQAEPTREVRAAAARIGERTPGGFVINHPDNPYTTLLPHAQKTREVLALVQYDALLAALEKTPDAAVRSARVALDVARAVGEEPFLISQLVRLACARIAAQTAAQILAWGEPKTGLADLQAALTAEADEPRFLHGVRGERAGLHKLFDGLESGKISTRDLVAMFDGNAPTFWQAGGLRLYKAMLPGDHAECLRVMNEYVAAAKLPPHEQLAALKAVRLPPRPPSDFRYLVTSLMVPAVERVGQAAVRNRAELLAAAAGIACERFRQMAARWPESLDEIPKDILPAVPTDPYTGGPILMQRMPDGVAVYSVGPQPRPHEKKTGPLPGGGGLGWRLYDPDQRRLDPPPEPKQVAPPEEPKDP